MFNNRTFFVLLIALLLGIWYFAGRNGADKSAYDRPNDPWVFRSVLDKTPRMITFALNDDLWAAYSTDSCALYKVWAGGVNFEGAVYNTDHGPQPTSRGNAWFENAHHQPWSVSIGGKTETPKTDYKGHRYADGHAELMYDLVLSTGQRIRINERPEYVNRNRQRGFERRYSMEGAPAGAVVSLRANVSSVADANASITVDNGTFKINKTSPRVIGRINAVDVEGEITLNNNAETTFTTWFVNAPLIANPMDLERAAEESSPLSPGEKLIAKSDCRTCHNEVAQTVGPSYVMISERYRNTPENVEMLVAKVRAGGSGVWGVAAMSAHPDLMPDDAKEMVAYILSLDEGEDDGEGGVQKDLASIPADSWLAPKEDLGEKEMKPGILASVFQLQKSADALKNINFTAKPDFTGVAPNIDAAPEDFGPFKDNFAIAAKGYLYLEKDDNVVLQLGSDDGSQLYLDDRLLIVNDGAHGMETKEAEVALRKGYHPIRIEYWQGGGGRGLQLKWARFGSPSFKVVPPENFFHKDNETPEGASSFDSGSAMVPGDGSALTNVHPAYTLAQARPETFLPKVSGMDFLSDGRLVVSTWDPTGSVYVLENVESGDPNKIKVKRIAKGLAEPLGVKVVNDTIYVLQKQELTQLIDADGDGEMDVYNCFAKGWRASANFHEFAFGLAFKDGYFYATLATAILPGGASARPQIPDRGKVMRISIKDGSIEFIARGLRTPNGIGIGADNELFVADNQGDWLPSSKIVHVKQGAFYGSYSVDSAAVANLPVQQPVVWLPQDEIGNSPSQPTFFNDNSPYKGQMMHGEVTHGGLKRVFVEKINGDYQGCVFRFTQGLEAGVNRVAWGPDGRLYVGGIGNPGNWSTANQLWYGLQSLEFNGNSVFEMLAVRAKTDGMEIEFTEPLPEGFGWDAANYQVQQWWYKPTVEYGGPKMDLQDMQIISANVSADRKKVFLEMAGLKSQHVVYFHLRNFPTSELGHEIWATEGWYTLNNIPAGNPGQKTTPVRMAENQLTAQEKKDGFVSLFDGKSLNGWHNYGKSTIGTGWIVDQNAIHLNAKPNPSGGWQSADGGDMLTADEYQDYELRLEWKIGTCGNSGIIYNVVEDPKKYAYVWHTGPEMQVLDNTCHPDAKIPKHRAGDLYDLMECRYVTVKPAGQWNQVRLIQQNGRVQHWLNGRKVVDIQMFNNGKPTKEWSDLIAKSKFPGIPAPDFGLSNKGRIALQDHGDPVWYKNIRIRKF